EPGNASRGEHDRFEGERRDDPAPGRRVEERDRSAPRADRERRMSSLGRAFPLVIAAPSGAGKTSLARALVERHDDVVFSISATTRPRRGYEVHGKDYYFVDDVAFDRMISSGELLEWATVHGYRYGTPRQGVTECIRRGEVVVLDIDVQGARQIRAVFPESVLVFVLPPSAVELN